MRRKLRTRATAAILAAAMAMSMAACTSTNTPAEPTPAAGNTDSGSGSETTDSGSGSDTAETTPAPVEDVEPYTVLTHADGSPIDLGGMEIVIRDWWSDPNDIFLTNPKNEYDDARKEYVEWAMEKYNFKITQQAISDWAGAPQDFLDYVSTGGDDNNYIFVIRDDATTAQCVANEQMYDLSKLDCLDFNDEMFTANKVHEQYTYKGGIYAMYAGMSEPRGGFFINKDIVGEDTVQKIYDAQANDTWDWDMFVSILDEVQKDTDNDGTNDIWGVTGNTGGWATMFAAANGGELVGNSANGYVYRVEDAQSMEGFQFCVDLLDKYYMPRPADAQWDYYKEEFLNGTVAFCENGGIYPANPNGEFAGAKFPMAYVMCPKGPQGTLTNVWSNNPHVIPACYDDEKAWNLAFAFTQYYATPVGFEDYNSYVETLKVEDKLDDRAYEETVPMMSQPEHGMVTYASMIPGLNSGEDFTWKFGPGADVSAIVEGVHESWNTLIDQANGQ